MCPWLCVGRSCGLREQSTLHGAIADADPPGLLQVTCFMGLPNASWGFPAGWGSLLLLNCSPKAECACETLEISGCQMFKLSCGEMMCSAQAGPNLGLYLCSRGSAWGLSAINPPCLQSGQAEAILRLVLGALLEYELEFLVLRHMWIMAMGKKLNGGSLSSLSKSPGTRAWDMIQLTWGSALPLGCGVLQTWAEFGSSSRRAPGDVKTATHEYGPSPGVHPWH